MVYEEDFTSQLFVYGRYLWHAASTKDISLCRKYREMMNEIKDYAIVLVNILSSSFHQQSTIHAYLRYRVFYTGHSAIHAYLYHHVFHFDVS